MSATTDDVELELQTGDNLQLQFVGDERDRRYNTRVIGYLPGQSLLVTTPRRDNKIMLIREGQPVVIRMLSGDSVYAFTSQVLCTCSKPYPYLHLGYPKQLERIVVRKAQRARADLIISVYRGRQESDDRDPKSAVMLDISTTGSLLRSTAFIGEVGADVRLATRINIGTVQSYLSIPGAIRNVREERSDDGRTLYYTGVEFQVTEKQDIILLHGFVYERLYSNLR